MNEADVKIAIAWYLLDIVDTALDGAIKASEGNWDVYDKLLPAKRRIADALDKLSVLVHDDADADDNDDDVDDNGSDSDEED